ncbi:hypothetical protein GW17_00013684 [Ensete ventricosum]|nr:hypothetical protein GW17_00013684 [Ensete ventricosum]
MWDPHGPAPCVPVKRGETEVDARSTEPLGGSGARSRLGFNVASFHWATRTLTPRGAPWTESQTGIPTASVISSFHLVCRGLDRATFHFGLIWADGQEEGSFLPGVVFLTRTPFPPAS